MMLFTMSPSRHTSFTESRRSVSWLNLDPVQKHAILAPDPIRKLTPPLWPTRAKPDVAMKPYAL